MSRQQVMLRGARLGHRVLLVEAGHFLGEHLWLLLDRRRRRSLARRLFATEEVVSGVVVGKAHKVLRWRSRFGIQEAANPVVTAWSLRPGAVRLAFVARGVREFGGMEPDVVLANGAPAFVEPAPNSVGRDGDADWLRRSQFAAREKETKTERLLKLVRRELKADGPAA